MRCDNYMSLKNDSYLKSLIAIVLLCGFAKIFGTKLNILIYLCLFFHFFLIIKAEPKLYLPVILFNHTCSSMYSSIGFEYIFNFTIFIFLVKMILKKTMPKKKLFLLILILYFYNFALFFMSGLFEMGSIVSSISSLVSYLFIIYLVEFEEDIDLNLSFKYFFYGFIVSGISAFSLPFSRWGFDIPTAYRYVGYLRDANYFSVDALLLMNLSVIKFKKISKYFFLVFVIGILSVSKMFLLLSIVCLLLHFLNGLFSRNRKYFYIALVGVCFLPLIFSWFQHTSFYQLLYDKYVYRMETNSLLTGRDIIQKYYINYLLNHPFRLIFGAGLDYRHVIGGGLSHISIYGSFGAHNTYLDIVLSFGFVGIIIYIELILKLFSALRKSDDKMCTNKGPYGIMVFVIALSLFALSYLNVDFFAILIFLLIIVHPCVKGRELNDM